MSRFSWLKENAPWLFSGLGLVVYKHVNQYLKDNSLDLTYYNIFQIFIIIIACYFALSIITIFKKKNILPWAKDKFLESVELIFYPKPLYLDSPLKYECFHLHEEYHIRLRMFHKFICFAQGWLAQFSFIAAEMHKKIKDLMKDDNPDPQQLKNLCDGLEEELTAFQQTIFTETCKFIKNHFHHRSTVVPKVCIKVVSDDDQDKRVVYAAFREKWEYNAEYPINANKGFKEVYRTGKSYICNDIPGEVNNSSYYNPRIHPQKVADIYFKYLDPKNATANWNNWKNCWISNSKDDGVTKEQPSDESCYMSTLIIPLTLLNNKNLKESFREHFEIPKTLSNDEEPGRAIYGFLCIDHMEANFFNSEVDTKIGYIFADILSIFLIHNLIYTKYSKTFKNARKISNP